MPRDTSHVSHQVGVGEPAGSLGVDPSTRTPMTVGERLRSAREARGLSLDELADATKVRASLLAALEEMRIEALPSRPFAIGYVRSYAEALGLDADALVSRFRTESPEPSELLRAPVGLSYETRARMPMMGGAAVAVVAAIVLYNVAQRALTADAPVAAATPAEADAWGVAELPAGPVRIGPAIPPPADQTTPAPYITPGLEEAYAAATGTLMQVSAVAVAPTPGGPLVTGSSDFPTLPVRSAFDPKGAVYGAEAPQPQRAVLILQAKKSGTVIVRGADGTVHFARVLSPGDAYRAPPVSGLTVEVSNPADFDLYRDGDLRGSLTQPLTSLDKLAALAPAR